MRIKIAFFATVAIVAVYAENSRQNEVDAHTTSKEVV